MWICLTLCSRFSYTAISLSNSSSMPRPEVATTGTMGTPIILPKASWSNLAPLRSSSSYILSAMTILGLMSISSVVRYRLRSRFEATTVLIMISGV